MWLSILGGTLFNFWLTLFTVSMVNAMEYTYQLHTLIGIDFDSALLSEQHLPTLFQGVLDPLLSLNSWVRG